MKRILSILFLTLALVACSQDETGTGVTDVTVSDKSASIITADNQFGLELFGKVNASLGEPKNTMISPMSVSLALAMVTTAPRATPKPRWNRCCTKPT